MYLPDNSDMFTAYDSERERRIRKLPKCACCGEYIQSETAYNVDGLYCEDCFEEWKDGIKVYVDDLEG